VLLRVALASLLVLGLARACATDIVAGLLPGIGAEVAALDSDFSILSLDFGQDGPSHTVRLRANLAHPIDVAGRTVSPLGWLPDTEGWYQVDLNARGVLQSSIILLIVLLGWPQRSWRELGARLLLALPLLVLLIAVDAPLELLGNLQESVARHWDPQGFRPLFAWDVFLEGGGNSALALGFAALAIAGARLRS
jgi:hypothetical protein